MYLTGGYPDLLAIYGAYIESRLSIGGNLLLHLDNDSEVTDLEQHFIANLKKGMSLSFLVNQYTFHGLKYYLREFFLQFLEAQNITTINFYGFDVSKLNFDYSLYTDLFNSQHLANIMYNIRNAIHCNHSLLKDPHLDSHRKEQPFSEVFNRLSAGTNTAAEVLSWVHILEHAMKPEFEPVIMAKILACTNLQALADIKLMVGIRSLLEHYAGINLNLEGLNQCARSGLTSKMIQEIKKQKGLMCPANRLPLGETTTLIQEKIPNVQNPNLSAMERFDRLIGSAVQQITEQIRNHPEFAELLEIMTGDNRTELDMLNGQFPNDFGM